MPELRGASLHVVGVVQGVGFRPFVYGLAKRYGLAGWVRNTSAGVDLQVDGMQADLDFLQALKGELPPLARMDSVNVTFSDARGFAGFEILPSETLPGAFQPISPDVSICADCLRELLDPRDRRYHYPFINCTNCGPRFTIITDIPYDRPNTTMAPFEMCPTCTAEYGDPLDRRFHAQPVACPVCGPRVWLQTNRVHADRLEGEAAIRETRRLLGKGKIVAIKGLGGFHLACDATNMEAVTELRRRKLRVDKPFALMMPDLETVEQHCRVSAPERDLLQSRQRPVVLLERRQGSPVVAEVGPRQDSLGVMLPYTPLHYLLFATEVDRQETIARVLVMTSGNLSEEPIATGNDAALERLACLADAFLLHDRDIRMRCDDSVVRVVDLPTNDPGEKKTFYPLRRSRGYAPDPIQLPFGVPSILAVGGELKNTFCLVREAYAFLSHHIGDMENYETLHSFKDGVGYFERLFRVKPTSLAYDLHPDYLTTRYALQRALQEDLPAFAVQHHHAHIAACMADHGLQEGEKVIGVAFDGTGYGTDGAIWGGEFLLAGYPGFKRPYNLTYFPLPGGDASIKRPARTALALLWYLGMDWEEWLAPVSDLCYEERQALRIQLERGLNTPLTSSMGRLFDAAAALSGVRQRVNYEAQAAMEFESAADEQETGEYVFEIQGDHIHPGPVVSALLADVRAGVPLAVVSARFHNGVAGMVLETCRKMRQDSGLQQVAMSGGVWQNMFLLKKTCGLLRADGFRVLLHHQVPTNDGGISLGQAMVAAAQAKAGEKA